MNWDDNLDAGTPAHNLASSKEKTIRSVAGPGSGKSFAIQRRIVRLIGEGVKPERILAITFTRTAAKDLKRDIGTLKVDGAKKVVARTLHSHALNILMRAEIIEQTQRVPRMILEHEIRAALRDLDEKKYGSIKDREELKDAYLAAWATLQVDQPGFTKEAKQAEYEVDLVRWMKDHTGMLVGEVIPEAIKYLKHNPACDAIGAFDVILVDEYQDLNRSEQEFIKLIRGKADIVIVGDDDQSIYRFKHAHPEGIQTVESLHGKYADIPFEQCRRCPTLVTKLASNLISNNPNRTLGKLVPFEKNPKGDVSIVQWRNYDEEVPGIAKLIQQELSKGEIEPKDVLILAPRRLIGYQLRDQLLKVNIPVQSYFRESAIKKLEVQRAYSLLNLIAVPEDRVALRFLLGAGSQDCRAPQYKKLTNLAAENKLTLRVTLEQVLAGKLKTTGLSTIVTEYRRILKEIDEIRAVLKENPDSLFSTLFATTEEMQIEFYELEQIYLEVLLENGAATGSDESTQRKWFQEVFTKIQEKVTNPEIPDDIDHVRIMSLHSSKGLSARFVIICAMIDELMPFLPKDLKPEEIEAHIQEQRRLFYVAITRCKGDTSHRGKLMISSFVNIPGNIALKLNIPSKPNMTRRVKATRFINELGNEAPAAVIGSSLLTA